MSLPPAPLEREALVECLARFGESRMLPRAAYVDQAVFDWESDHFFAGGWMCLARSEDLGLPGDQRAVHAGTSGVLLIRGHDGLVRAFANTCRHRGHELLACGASANRAIVICPYHSWSYLLDGSLRRAPGYHELEGFDPSKHGLVELAAEERHGFVFVDASRAAGPLEEHLAGLDEVLGPYEVARLQTVVRHDYVVAANWKILTENYHECYHCPTIHPELCKVTEPDSGYGHPHPGEGAWSGGWMDLKESAETMSFDGSSPATPLRGLDEGRRRVVDYLGIFPNLLVSLHPDYVMTHVLTPLSAASTRVECSWAFAPEAIGVDGFDPSGAVDFWEVTNTQDFAACESVQRGLSSPHAVPGVLSALEGGVYEFVTMVARGYLGLRVTVGSPQGEPGGPDGPVVLV